MNRIAILDDYQDAALASADWDSIPGAEITVQCFGIIRIEFKSLLCLGDRTIMLILFQGKPGTENMIVCVRGSAAAVAVWSRNSATLLGRARYGPNPR